jgi:hypothetical protein
MLLRRSHPSPATSILTVRDHHMHTISLGRTKFYLILTLLHVTTGGLVTMLIIIRRNMEKLQVASREDACLSLPGASTIVTMDHSLFTFLRTNTSSHLSIIINRRRTIIIYHRQAMMSSASFRKWMTISHLLRWVSRRSIALYTNKWSGSKRRPRGLTNYATTSNNNKPSSSIYSVR